MSTKTTGPDPKDEYQLISFPSGIPKPHEARAWGRSLDNIVIHYPGLSSVARNRMPPGLFGPAEKQRKQSVCEKRSCSRKTKKTVCFSALQKNKENEFNN